MRKTILSTGNWLLSDHHYECQVGVKSVKIQEHLRIIVVNVNFVSSHLLQREDMNNYSMEYIASLCKKLIKPPAFLLICFKNICKNRCEQYLQASEDIRKINMII